MKMHRTSVVLALSLTSKLLVAAQEAATKWATIIGTDSFGADVYPQGFTGTVDPMNVEAECKSWCLSVPTCTMFLYYETGSGVCYIKTGGPASVEYQPVGPVEDYNLVMRNMDCSTAMRYITPYVDPGNQVPQCIDSTGNTDDGQDDVPRGALNEPCLGDGSCLNGNLCDPLPEGENVCKSPMGGNCLQVSDCSSTISDLRLECTLEGGTNQNRICAIPAPAAEPEPPAPSQDAARKKRNAVKARWLKQLQEECPGNSVACPIGASSSFECVSVNEELAHCGTCGNDCQQLAGVHKMGVTCANGQCLIYRCRKGFRLIGDTCVPKSSTRL